MPSISSDGRYVAFYSYTTNLVDSDTNGALDIFVHDRQTGETTRVSIASDGTQGNDHSLYPSISADGRYVTFASVAFNLVSGDTNNAYDVFVNDQGIGGTQIRPVILVPGMFALWNPACMFSGLKCNDETAWGFFPVMAKEVYQPLIDKLALAGDGYTEENHYLKIVHYNWMRPIESNIQRLMDKINEVKNATGASQVDLIGHSMGGLLTRAYVQSGQYPARNDVAHLITLGSPHMGSAKAYPYWEGGYLYEPLPEEYNQLVILLDYISKYYPQQALLGLRTMIPSFQDILPTAYYTDIVEDQLTYGYLYDGTNGDLPIAEAEMVQHNDYLTNLYTNVSLLFERTDAYAFYGTAVSTTARFYVRPRHFWEWPAWDDGAPIWSRMPEFKRLTGDGTVMAFSAALPCPGGTSDCIRSFSGVDHGQLPGNTDVITETFNILGIYQSRVKNTTQVPQHNMAPLLVLSVFGDADFTITDPSGRSIGPGVSEIPGAEYTSASGDPYKLVLIPAPVEGNFQVDVQGSGEGQYTLSLLDNFTPPAPVITDTKALWDTAQSQIQTGITVTFEMIYTEATSPTTSLIAVTPVIQTPVWMGNIIVEGRALPGQAIEIRDYSGDTLLGSASVDTDGHFLVTLNQPLQIGQRIYPWSEGVSGIPVTVEGYLIFIPLTQK